MEHRRLQNGANLKLKETGIILPGAAASVRRTGSWVERPDALPPAGHGGATNAHSRNQLLARLGTQEIEGFFSHLKIVALDHGELLAGTHSKIQKVYFPHTGILSCVVDLKHGQAIETGMIGNDGVFGAAEALDDKVSLNRVTVQVPGIASVIDADRLRAAAEASQSFRTLLIEYELFLLAQAQQTAACNAVHDVEARMCRWLLRMHDLAGVDLPLTHEFLAQMIGVTRPSVTAVAGEMQRAGMISYRRGRLHILDIEKVQHKACECHEDVRSHYHKTMGFNGEAIEASKIPQVSP